MATKTTNKLIVIYIHISKVSLANVILFLFSISLTTWLKTTNSHSFENSEKCMQNFHANARRCNSGNKLVAIMLSGCLQCRKIAAVKNWQQDIILPAGNTAIPVELAL